MNFKKIRWNRSLITGILFGAFALFYFAGSFGLAQRQRYAGIGAEFMPRVYAAIMMLCALAQLYEGLKTQKQAGDDAPPADEPEQRAARKISRRNVLIVFVLIFVYITALKPVGFMLASALFLFVLCNLLTPDYAKRNLAGYAVFSVILSAGCYFLFKNILYIALPVGSIFGG